MASKSGSTATDVLDGARAIAPVVVGLVPAGVAVGTAWAAAGLPLGPGLLASATVYGLSAQLVVADLGARGAAAGIVAVTVAVLSLRLAILGLGLGRHLEGTSTRARWVAALLLVDPVYLVAEGRFGAPTTPDQRRRFYLGAAGFLWVAWQAANVVGLLLGEVIPAGAALDASLPLVLMGLLATRLRDRGSRIAAAGAGVAALVARPAPFGSGLLVAVCIGVVAATRFGGTR